MYEHVKTELKKISTALKEKYPDTILSVIAFGSRVRGDHTERSDFDVLVVVENRDAAIEEGIVDIFVEEEMKTGISFDPVIKTAGSMELEKQHHTPFYENISTEGIPV
jgi:predicted nucleotidyltransferase